MSIRSRFKSIFSRAKSRAKAGAARTKARSAQSRAKAKAFVSKASSKSKSRQAARDKTTRAKRQRTKAAVSTYVSGVKERTKASVERRVQRDIKAGVTEQKARRRQEIRTEVARGVATGATFAVPLGAAFRAGQATRAGRAVIGKISGREARTLLTTGYVGAEGFGIFTAADKRKQTAGAVGRALGGFGAFGAIARARLPRKPAPSGSLIKVQRGRASKPSKAQQKFLREQRAREAARLPEETKVTRRAGRDFESRIFENEFGKRAITAERDGTRIRVFEETFRPTRKGEIKSRKLVFERDQPDVDITFGDFKPPKKTKPKPKPKPKPKDGDAKEVLVNKKVRTKDGKIVTIQVRQPYQVQKGESAAVARAKAAARARAKMATKSKQAQKQTKKQIQKTKQRQKTKTKTKQKQKQKFAAVSAVRFEKAIPKTKVTQTGIQKFDRPIPDPRIPKSRTRTRTPPVPPFAFGVGGRPVRGRRVREYKFTDVGGRYTRSFTARVLGLKSPKKVKRKRQYTGLELRL